MIFTSGNSEPRPRIRGIITGASPKGTYVRLLKFPAEGMVVRGTRGINVGDTVRVRLASVDAAKGFIDFERMQGPGIRNQGFRVRWRE